MLGSKNNFKTAGKFFNQFMSKVSSWHHLKASVFLAFSGGIKKRKIGHKKLNFESNINSLRSQCCHFIPTENAKKPECIQAV